MASQRGFLMVTIEAEPGWHIGADDDHLGAPGGLVEEGGLPRLPVTSLMGSLRDYLRGAAKTDPSGAAALCTLLKCDSDEKLPKKDLAAALLGPEGADKSTNAEEVSGLSASSLWGLNIDITRKDGSALQKDDIVERGRTAIDRRRGAALSNALWQGTEVAVPTQITLRLRLDKMDDVLQSVAAALYDWRPALGGGTTTGSGQAKVMQVTYGSIDLDTVDGLITLWSNPGSKLVDVVATKKAGRGAGASQSEPLRQQKFLVAENLRITNGMAEASKKTAGLTLSAQRGEKYLVRLDGKYVVPGTTWKGLIRSRFEYILRTAAEAYGRPDILDDLACTDRDKCAKKAAEQAKVAEGKRPEGANATVLAGGCIACRVFGSQNRVGEVAFSNSRLSTVKVASRTRNAIDRFSGGVKDSALFAETTLDGSAEQATLDLVITQMPGKTGDLLAKDLPTRAVILKILDLAIQDIGEGFVSVGSRTSTGLGILKFSEENQPRQASKLTSDDMECLLGALQEDILAPKSEMPKGGKKSTADESTSTAENGTRFDKSNTPPQDGSLVGYGEQGWSQVAELLKGMTAVWFGIDGPQTGPVPPAAPIGATHLWAWSEKRLARARIQDGKAIMALLCLSEADVPSSPVCPEKVEYTLIDDASTMDIDDGRIGMNPESHKLVQRTTDVYIVNGATPLEFIKLREG